MIQYVARSKKDVLGTPVAESVVDAQQQAVRPEARFRPRLDPMEDRTLLSTVTVMNNHDSGPGSLRAAIAAASSGDTIDFLVPAQR